MNLDQILQSGFSGLDKANPQTQDELNLEDVPSQDWNLLKGHLPMPQAVLKGTALKKNAQWMSSFLARTGAKLAPHGKTTMCPQLFQLQMQSGAWGITVATVKQALVCIRYGVNRIFMANQLVGDYEIRTVLSALAQKPDLQFFCLVDSIENTSVLAQEAEKAGVALNVLVEIGAEGGRTGCRTRSSAVTLARAVKNASPHLVLAGVECYEGLFVSEDAEKDQAAVSQMLDAVIQTAVQCEQEALFTRNPIMLSAGGSAYFDMVSHQWSAPPIQTPVEVVIRSGCYLTHDSKFYDDLFNLLLKRISPEQRRQGRLQPALEVWSYVQSRPEPDRIILTMGKRDCSFDIALPKADRWFSPGRHEKPLPLAAGFEVFSLSDQHAWMRIPPGSEIQVGDMISCGISHPCTTFDKWRTLFVVDDDYNVTSAVKTFF